MLTASYCLPSISCAFFQSNKLFTGFATSAPNFFRLSLQPFGLAYRLRLPSSGILFQREGPLGPFASDAACDCSADTFVRITAQLVIGKGSKHFSSPSALKPGVVTALTIPDDATSFAVSKIVSSTDEAGKHMFHATLRARRTLIIGIGLCPARPTPMHIEGCKHELEVTIPVEEIERETDRVIANIQKKAKLPGFRPGKAPASIVRSRFAHEVRQDVLEALLPKHLQKRFRDEDLKVVGTPNIRDIHFESGEPLRFKAEFEVAPEFELGEYQGLTVPYDEPQVSDDDVNQRLDQIREQKAQYVTVDPRPVENGDHALVMLDSLSGVDKPIRQEEMMLRVGDEDTMPAFTQALLGMTPEEEKEFDITYPEDYGQEKLAGKTVRFRMQLKAIRRKELPELNDEFAKDLGDYNSLDELKDAVRKTLFAERQYAAQQRAKERLLDVLIETHDFAVPEAFIDNQVEGELEEQARQWAARGVDLSKVNIDWEKLKASGRPKAIRQIKASLLLDKISEREAINATQDEVDHEVQRIARQTREPVAAVRKKLEKDGSIGRIAYRLRTEKTLNFLFERARKVAGEPEPAPAE